MVAQTGHDVVIENPIAELRPNAIEGKRYHDRSRNNQCAGEERCQRAENLPPTDTQSLAANENQSHRTPDQSRHDEEQCLHGDAKAKTHEETRDQRAPRCQSATEQYRQAQQPKRRPKIVRPEFNRTKSIIEGKSH
jgi:hypothetical protein